MAFCAPIIIAWFVTETPIPDHVATELKAYLASKACRDGGWGIHSTGERTVTGTAINYIVMRILGMCPDEPLMANARAFLLSQGGAVRSSIWGKLWMAIMGIVDWDIVHPIPPEIWLLPEWLPFHPWRLYAEIRIANQPMGYLYSKRWQYKETKFITSLREELLAQPYSTIMWAKHRTQVAPGDLAQPQSWAVGGLQWIYLNIWKPYFLTDSLKERAEARVNELINMQAINSSYGGIAATDAPMSTIIAYFRDGPNSSTFRSYVDKLQEYLWMSGEGMLINSSNGSQSWDTAFIVQGVCATGLHLDDRWRGMLVKALQMLEQHQLREDVAHQEKCHLQQRRGCWTFSNKYQGFAVSDCTAEALKAVIMLQTTGKYPHLLDDQRLFDAVDSMILYQNNTGGVSAFEARNGSTYLELLNMSEMWSNFMVDYDYPECTASCVYFSATGLSTESRTLISLCSVVSSGSSLSS